MRVLLVAGLNDLAKGGDFDSITTEFKRFAHVVRHANDHHLGVANQVAVAPLLPAPKFVWYPDNGTPPPGYRNRREEVERINEWVKVFNARNDIHQVPRFNIWGTRTTKRYVEGTQMEFKTHRWNEWRVSEPAGDKLHLCDKMRVKMAKYVIKYFESEREKKGVLLPYR